MIDDYLCLLARGTIHTYIENKLCVCGAHKKTERPKKPVQEQLVMIEVMMMVVVMIFVFPFYIYKLPINRLCGRYVQYQVSTLLVFAFR